MITESELAALHAAVEGALARRDEAGLRVIGYGEISLGVGWPPQEPRVVAKRMPPFRDRAAYDRYAATLGRYVQRLEAAGVSVLETEVRSVTGSGGAVIAYGIQPALPAETLGPAVLRDVDPGGGHPLLDAAVDATVASVGARLGFDAQISNWSWSDPGAVFFDVTTPFIRDEAGWDEMDFEVLVASYPRVLRGVLRRFVAPSIIARYHDRRAVLTDVAANLIKERLEPWIVPFLALANSHLAKPLTEGEVRRYYRSDARTWTWIQRVRRADRAWHRLRGRTYPFLIPGEIER